MEMPLQIVMRDGLESRALEARIRRGVAKLGRLHPRVLGCRVTLEQAGRHHRQGRQFEVRIDLRVRGRELVASRQHDTDPYAAVRDALGALRRQLEDEATLRRGKPKIRARSTVKE